MRKRHQNILIIILVVLFILLGIPTYYIFSVDTSTVYSEPKYVEIPSGATTTEVVNILTESRILKHPTTFIFLVRFTGMHKKIRAGRFKFERPVSVMKLVRILTRGGSFDIKITIPEGYTIYNIAGLLHRELGIDSVSFLASCKDSAVLNKLNIPGPTAEGFLFPETYSIPKEISPDSIISIMFNEFQRRWTDEYQVRADSLGFSKLEIITLASIIEAEAHQKEEQTIISSVYHNRIKLNMLLQADPTTIYGLRKFDKPLILTDLDDDSPYNTYRHAGLPPGPICNPGEDAIYAALYPDSTDYLYFVSRRDGTHIFSKTIQQHHRAIQTVKKLMRNKSQP